ncbi:MAG TPA: VWA domain-containing protein [Myxococcales bacterium]|nr:VWA domain-containing protein [Myxococcales bacterium]
MDAALVEFAALLRQGGLRVSAAELADGARALTLVGLDDRGTARAALESALVKRERDTGTFRRLFDLYFGGAATLLADLEKGLLQRLTEEGLLEPDALEMLAWELSNRPLSPLARATLSGDTAEIARLLRGAALQVNLSQLSNPLQQGFFARRVGGAAGVGSLSGELAELEAALRARGLDPAAIELIGKRLAETLRGVESAVHRIVEREAAARLGNRRSTLEEKPFSALTQREIEDMEAAVRKLAERLKARLMRRQKARRRGTLHVRRTLRRNLGAGGTPFRLAFRGKRPQRPDVVVLCDVSDSVRNASRLMLLFMYTLQSLFTRVRSFAFVSDIGELTGALRGVDARRAIDLALAGKVVSLYANSNYGRALALFAREHLGVVTRRTTVLVIGDGRNNYNAPNEWALEDIRRKARRLVWISPEPRSSWGLGDSEMHRYVRHCSQVAIVNSLADLARLAEEIVPA